MGQGWTDRMAVLSRSRQAQGDISGPKGRITRGRGGKLRKGKMPSTLPRPFPCRPGQPALRFLLLSTHRTYHGGASWSASVLQHRISKGIDVTVVFLDALTGDLEGYSPSW